MELKIGQVSQIRNKYKKNVFEDRNAPTQLLQFSKLKIGVTLERLKY